MRRVFCRLGWLVIMGLMAAHPLASAHAYKLERLVRGGSFQGVQGIAFDPAGRMLVGSLLGQAIYEVSAKGKARPVREGEEASADQIAIAPDGSWAWSQPWTGRIKIAKEGETPRDVLATPLPQIQFLTFDRQGRLYASQIFGADALYQIDPRRETTPRKIAEGLGGFSGFQFGPDGWLYGALRFKGQVVKINVETGEVFSVTDGLQHPVAVVFDKDQRLFVADAATGQIIEIDRQSGKKTLLTRLGPGLHSLATDAKGDIFATNPADNAIIRVYANSGRPLELTSSKIAVPSGLTFQADLDGDRLYITDFFSFRRYDFSTGKIKDIVRPSALTKDYPSDVSVTGGKTAYVSSWLNGTVQRIDRRTGQQLSLAVNFQQPMRAIDLPGPDFAVLEYGAGQLTKVSNQDHNERTVLVGNLQGPVGIVRDGDEALFVTEYLAGRVVRIDLQDFSSRIVVSGLRQPEGIDLDAEKRLIVAETGARQIVAIDAKSGKLSVLARDLPIGGSARPKFAPANFLFTGLAVDPKGAIYFSADPEGAIYRLVPD